MLRIQGRWFQELGFNIGDPVLVKCEEGKLIIMADTAMAELKKAEKAFMEEETRKAAGAFPEGKEGTDGEVHCGKTGGLLHGGGSRIGGVTIWERLL